MSLSWILLMVGLYSSIGSYIVAEEAMITEPSNLDFNSTHGSILLQVLQSPPANDPPEGPSMIGSTNSTNNVTAVSFGVTVTDKDEKLVNSTSTTDSVSSTAAAIEPLVEDIVGSTSETGDEVDRDENLNSSLSSTQVETQTEIQTEAQTEAQTDLETVDVVDGDASLNSSLSSTSVEAPIEASTEAQTEALTEVTTKSPTEFVTEKPTPLPSSSPTPLPSFSPTPPVTQIFDESGVQMKDALFTLKYVREKMGIAEKRLFQLRMESFLLEYLPPFQSSKTSSRYDLAKLSVEVSSQILRQGYRFHGTRMMKKGDINKKELLVKLQFHGEYGTDSIGETKFPPTDQDFADAIENFFIVDNGSKMFVEKSFLEEQEQIAYFNNVTSFEIVREVIDYPTPKKKNPIPERRKPGYVVASLVIGTMVAIFVFVAGFAARSIIDDMVKNPSERSLSINISPSSSSHKCEGTSKKPKSEIEFGVPKGATQLSLSGDTADETEFISNFESSQDCKSVRSNMTNMTSNCDIVRNTAWSPTTDLIQSNDNKEGSNEFFLCHAPPGSLGVGLKTMNGYPVVCKLKPGSPLVKTLIPGDIICSIDGIDTSKMSASAVTNIMAAKRKCARKIVYGRMIKHVA